MTTRIKSKDLGLQTEAQFRAAVDAIADLQLKLNALIADRDGKIQAIRDAAEVELAPLAQERDRLLVLTEAYAKDHREQLLPTERKSAETGLAAYGFRLGMPTLKTLNAKWTWARVLERVKELGRMEFITVKEALDKDRIKTDLTTDAELAEIGCRIEQTDAFFIEPKDQGAKEVV